MNTWERCQNFPPCLVRLLARDGTKALHWRKICDVSLMTPLKVECISQMTSWDEVTVKEMRDFTLACNYDFCDVTDCKRADNYIRFATRKSAVPFRYLRLDEQWKDYYLPLMILWRKSQINLPAWEPLRKLVQRLTPLLKK